MCGDGSDVAAVPPATPGTKGAEAGGSFGEEGEEESRQAESRAEADIGVANAACEELDELRRTFAALENF